MEITQVPLNARHTSGFSGGLQYCNTLLFEIDPWVLKKEKNYFFYSHRNKSTKCKSILSMLLQNQLRNFRVVENYLLYLVREANSSPASKKKETTQKSWGTGVSTFENGVKFLRYLPSWNRHIEQTGKCKVWKLLSNWNNFWWLNPQNVAKVTVLTIINVFQGTILGLKIKLQFLHDQLRGSYRSMRCASNGNLGCQFLIQSHLHLQQQLNLHHPGNEVQREGLKISKNGRY